MEFSQLKTLNNLKYLSLVREDSSTGFSSPVCLNTM